MKPLTATERAYFDTIKDVTRSARPEDLRLHRMTLDGKEVAVVVQTIIKSGTAELAGYQPLAIICDDDMAERLRSVDGSASVRIRPDGLEGAST